MLNVRSPDLNVIDPDVVRTKWLGDLNALATQVRIWVENHGWRTRLVLKPVRDEPLGRFEVPLLLMERDAVQVALSPITRFPGDAAEGAVDLYVVPAYDEFAGLLREDDQWMIYYTFEREAELDRNPESWRIPLAEDVLLQVLDMMVARDAESL